MSGLCQGETTLTSSAAAVGARTVRGAVLVLLYYTGSSHNLIKTLKKHYHKSLIFLRAKRARLI